MLVELQTLFVFVPFLLQDFVNLHFFIFQCYDLGSPSTALFFQLFYVLKSTHLASSKRNSKSDVISTEDSKGFLPENFLVWPQFGAVFQWTSNFPGLVNLFPQKYLRSSFEDELNFCAEIQSPFAVVARFWIYGPEKKDAIYVWNSQSYSRILVVFIVA